MILKLQYLQKTNDEFKGYRDIMYYVCTPVYVRCQNTRHCVRSTKMCNGLKNCMNKWNSSNDCIHLKRNLHTISNDVDVVRNPPARFIGLFFTAFHFNIILLFKTTFSLSDITSVEKSKKTRRKIISFFIIILFFFMKNRFKKVLCF